VLQRAKHVFDRSSPYCHRVKLTIQSALHSVEYRFVFPSANAPIRRRRALLSERTVWAGSAPVGPQFQQIGTLQRGVAVYRALPCRTQILVVSGDVNEVGPVEATVSLCTGGL